jgi:hypothetical protein
VATPKFVQLQCSKSRLDPHIVRKRQRSLALRGRGRARNVDGASPDDPGMCASPVAAGGDRLEYELDATAQRCKRFESLMGVNHMAPAAWH